MDYSVSYAACMLYSRSDMGSDRSGANSKGWLGRGSCIVHEPWVGSCIYESPWNLLSDRIKSSPCALHYIISLSATFFFKIAEQPGHWYPEPLLLALFPLYLNLTTTMNRHRIFVGCLSPRISKITANTKHTYTT